MTSSKDNAYFLAEAAHDAELARLRHRETVHGPRTRRLLTDLGVTSGWKCLEVGAGAGDAVHWLAERVGPAGLVVATDINLRFLEGTNLPNVQIRRHDILHDPLETETYDLVHCRSVLAHFRDFEPVVERMVRALRPGGVLLAEEPIRSPTEEVDPSWPLAADYTRVAAAVIRSLAAHGADLTMGLRLPRIFARLGLTGVAGNVEGKILAGGSSEQLLFGTAMNVMRRHFVAQGVLTDADIDAYLAAESNPGFFGIAYSLLGVWGRRP